jgi:hypothetical protein
LQQLLALNPTNLTEEDTGLWVCGHIMERHNAKIDLDISATNLTRIYGHLSIKNLFFGAFD